MAILLDLLVYLLRSFYILAASGIVLIRSIPILRDNFLEYGVRAQKQYKTSSNIWLNYLVEMTVPHGWFYHFYLVSIACSLYWLRQLYSQGSVITWIAGRSIDISSTPTGVRSRWCVLLMLMQGCRRLYECIFITKKSMSRMWIGHYLIGLAFYLTINVAIWIEAAQFASYESSRTGHDVPFLAPLDLLLRVSVPIVVFFAASIGQHQVHAYLAGLKTHVVPQSWAYRQLKLISPHYFFEVMIYLCFAVITAPKGSTLNVTVLTAVVFVTVNLGVTAERTKNWMLNKFPIESTTIKQRYNMIPFIW